MLGKLLLGLLVMVFFAAPVGAARSLPAGTQPESVEGEAVGTFPELRGSGTLTFINTGGEARLVTVCDVVTEKVANSETCTGIDVKGTFTGGPNGTAVFKTPGGTVNLELNDGKVFSFAAAGISMNFTVTDPSIFDAWVEGVETRDSRARVSSLSGQVEIACPPDLEAWDVLKMGRVILIDCHIKTGEDSKAVISFSDMTSFEMKSESEIVIESPPEKESKWSLLVGNIWVNVKQMVKDGTMKVHMSQAVAGIKGTRFMLTETGKESKIEVTEGTVVFQSKANGEETTVSAGESVTATEKGLSDKIMIDLKNGLDENKTVEDKGSGSKMMYIVGAAALVLVVIIIGSAILRKRK